MSPTKLYTVTLHDLGTYQVTVAADNETHAVAVAKNTLIEEAVAPCPGMMIGKREVEGTATLDDQQPSKRFRVHASFVIDLHLEVPASCREDAAIQAKRLYETDPMPWEYDNDGGSIHWRRIEEVVS